jgi:hypothetical protein
MRSRLMINTLLYAGRAMGRRTTDFSRRALGRAALMAVAIAMLAFAQGSTGDAQSAQGPDGGVAASGRDYKHDTSRPLRDIPPKPYVGKAEHEANRNPRAVSRHIDQPDAVVQSTPSDPAMPGVDLNFAGIGFPGVACNCAPPDTDGEVGRTQYTQIVNEGLQVFAKTTGASVFGPVGISTLWSGFGGVCESNGSGDPVVLYDQLADRWIVSQFAGLSVPTDECIAVSTTSDATGSYHRYAFHLGSSFFDYPKLAVWPDAYYMSMNVFNTAGTAYLGPQPFAFDRAAMLAGNTATFVTTGITGGSGEETYLPSDLDGKTLPPAGAPNTFVEFPSGGVYKVFHFHVDFGVPANSTFTTFATVPAAGFTGLCATTRSCVPQAGTTSRLDGIGDRLMFRAAYRNFGDHESVVTNYAVNSGGVAGVRWLELRNVTLGPVTVYQESTYQPDSTWRWMGSAAMDGNGNLAVGFSASSASISPQIRYAGRLATDPLNTLAQGESTLFAGTGSQTGTSSRWGDYSAMTIDPVDDCTFWYTSEYYTTTSSFNWRTRVGTFKFPQCASALGTLNGRVTDSVTGLGVSGASVQISGGLSTSTDATGNYLIDLAQGTYSVTFSKSSYVSQTVNNVVVTSGTTTTQNVALVPVQGGPTAALITASSQCTAFRDGTAVPLSSLQYTVRPNQKIASVTPNAFSYWLPVSGAAGSNTVVITQAITTGNFRVLFERQASSSVFNTACDNTGLSPTFTQTSTNAASGTVTVQWTAPAAGSYYIGLRLDPNNFSNKAAPKPTTTVHYDFSAAGVNGSAAGVNLVKQ